MGWKTGAKAYICQDDPEDKLYGLPSKIGRKVTVMATNCGGYHNIKVKDAEDNIFYVRSSWIKPLNKAKTNKETKEIKKAATEMAEQRMKEIMEKIEKPTFQDVCEKFYALASFGQKEEGAKEAKDIVLSLAEKALFDEIKDGVNWD